MKNITYHEGLFKVIKRLPQSRNGNPRYMVMVDGYAVMTPVDSQIAYRVPNFDNKKVKAHIGTFRGIPMLYDVQNVI